MMRGVVGMGIKKFGQTHKLVIATSLIAALVLPTTIFAKGTGDDPRHTKDVKTEKQKKAEKEKEKLTKGYASLKIQHAKNKQSGDVSTQGIGDTYNTISVDYFEQETNYYCGPATVKQVLEFINGDSESQDEYADMLGTNEEGTDFSKIDDVLNDEQDENTYVYRDFDSDEKDSWLDKIIWGIDNEYPTVLDLEIDPDYMPKYKTHIEGHILNTSGYDLEDWELRLTDPFDQGNRGVTIGNTWHPLDGVWEANQEHFRKAIIW
jgi:hypothetical protein